uniref:FYVE, RhoGEF and PH domain-containing protein 6 n=1 Tax=Strigamia maritima TaxID=126957 RepID=T1J575_STRMM
MQENDKNIRLIMATVVKSPTVTLSGYSQTKPPVPPKPLPGNRKKPERKKYDSTISLDTLLNSETSKSDLAETNLLRPRHQENKTKTIYSLKRRTRDDCHTPSKICHSFCPTVASFVVKTKNNCTYLTEKGKSQFFGKTAPKKPKQPATDPPTDNFVSSRPKIPPRQVVDRILADINNGKAAGKWHKLENVKYLDEEVSTEDSTDYSDVDWSQAIYSAPGEESIIYYTHIEEAPNERVIFYQSVARDEILSSSEEKESVVSHVAQIEDMELAETARKSVPKLEIDVSAAEKDVQKCSFAECPTVNKGIEDYISTNDFNSDLKVKPKRPPSPSPTLTRVPPPVPPKTYMKVQYSPKKSELEDLEKDDGLDFIENIEPVIEIMHAEHRVDWGVREIPVDTQEEVKLKRYEDVSADIPILETARPETDDFHEISELSYEELVLNATGESGFISGPTPPPRNRRKSKSFVEIDKTPEVIVMPNPRTEQPPQKPARPPKPKITILKQLTEGPPLIQTKERPSSSTPATELSISSTFSLEFLSKLSEIEAGKLNFDEINVKVMNVQEIHADVVRTGVLHVGVKTPMIRKNKGESDDDLRDENNERKGKSRDFEVINGIVQEKCDKVVNQNDQQVFSVGDVDKVSAGEMSDQELSQEVLQERKLTDTSGDMEDKFTTETQVTHQSIATENFSCTFRLVEEEAPFNMKTGKKLKIPKLKTSCEDDLKTTHSDTEAYKTHSSIFAPTNRKKINRIGRSREGSAISGSATDLELDYKGHHRGSRFRSLSAGHHEERRTSQLDYCVDEMPNTNLNSPRMKRLSLLSIPTSEDSWHNCTSGDESGSESSFGTAASGQDNSVVGDARRTKKFFIARELMTSERVFVDALKLLNEDFRNFVIQANAKSDQKVLPVAVLDQILKYLPQLHDLNEDLLKDLQERIQNWEQLDQIAEVITKKGPFLKLYSSYIKDFEMTIASLDEACKKYPLFAQIVTDFEASDRCNKLAIKHYMLKPVQRIPQYKLILHEYLKRLEVDSPEYEDTVSALNIVTDVANHANQVMKQGNNFSKLLNIQNRLVGGSYEVIRPGRLFLREGELSKLSRKVMQPRWFILFNDALLHTDVTQGSLRLHCELPLSAMRVVVPTNEEFLNEFSVISSTRSFTLSANSLQERDEWVSTLNNAIQSNAKRRGTLTLSTEKTIDDMETTLGKNAPVWIPDSRVTMCQLCTMPFTVTFRRHHCRACGKVICASCSANRAPLQYLKYQSVRVCFECFLSLTDGKCEGRRAGKKIERRLPSVLKEVGANHQGAAISGYLHKKIKKGWRRYWFVINDKVLYSYKASEDVAALESIPLLGFKVEANYEVFEGGDPTLGFQLTHPTHPLVFCGENEDSTEKWKREMHLATLLE